MPLKRKHDAVQALRDLGATMSFANMSEGNWDDTPEIQGPSLLRWLLGDEYFAEEPATINFRITHRAVTDSDLAQLRYLERLEMLIVDFEKTSRSSSNPPSGIRIPAWLTGEEDLGLPPTVIVKIGCTEVTDEGLAYISHLRNLQWLDLYGTSVTDAGLKHLPNLKKLERLTLHGSLVTEVGIKELQHNAGTANLSRGGALTTSVRLASDTPPYSRFRRPPEYSPSPNPPPKSRTPASTRAISESPLRHQRERDIELGQVQVDQVRDRLIGDVRVRDVQFAQPLRALSGSQFPHLRSWSPRGPRLSSALTFAQPLHPRVRHARANQR